jgi:hypothetical protein
MGSSGIPRTAVACLVGGWQAIAAPVASAEGALPVHLTYEAPASCPSEPDFMDMIAQAGGRLVQVPEAQSVRSFVVQITGTSPGTSQVPATFQARLIVREGNGTESVRELNDPRCDAVLRAAAVVVALSLDAPLTLTPAPPPIDSAEPPAESLEPLPPVPGIAAGIPPEEPLTEVYVRSDDDDAPAAPPAHPRWRFDVSGEGLLGTGAKPVMNSGFAAYVELLRDTPSAFAPAIRVGFQRDTDQGWSDLSFVRRTVGRIDACPLRGVVMRPWSTDAFTLQLCARVDIGKMDVMTWAQGSELDEQQLWLATAGLLRLRWTSPLVFVEVEGGPVVPLVRPVFTFGKDPDDPRNFETPSVAGTAGAGVGVFFL